MSPLLSLWSNDATGRATLLANGRVPPMGAAVALAASADAPRDARLRLEADVVTLLPRRVTQHGRSRVWVLTRAELAAADRWRAVLELEGDVLEAIDFRLDEDPPTVTELRVCAHLRDGTQRSVGDVKAGDVSTLWVSADVEDGSQRCEHLTLRVEDPLGRSWDQPVDWQDGTPEDEDEDGDAPSPPGVFTTIAAAPFADGDWTLSLLHRGRTLLRRLRLRVEPSPVTVRTATLLELGPSGATPIGPTLDRERLKRRLVFTYALDGVRPRTEARVELILRDGTGAGLGTWVRNLDRGDAHALERLWFPLSAGQLLAATGELLAELVVDGVPVHTERRAIGESPFRSDGTLVASAQHAAPEAGFGLAQAFFGLVARRRRRRRPEPAPPVDEHDLPF